MVTIAPEPPKIFGHVKTYREPDEVCHSCEKYWTDRGKEPRVMVLAPSRLAYGTKVMICPWCDGNTADFALRGHNG